MLSPATHPRKKAAFELSSFMLPSQLSIRRPLFFSLTNQIGSTLLISVTWKTESGKIIHFRARRYALSSAPEAKTVLATKSEIGWAQKLPLAPIPLTADHDSFRQSTQHTPSTLTLQLISKPVHTGKAIFAILVEGTNVSVLIEVFDCLYYRCWTAAIAALEEQ